MLLIKSGGGSTQGGGVVGFGSWLCSDEVCNRTVPICACQWPARGYEKFFIETFIVHLGVRY